MAQIDGVDRDRTRRWISIETLDQRQLPRSIRLPVDAGRYSGVRLGLPFDSNRSDADYGTWKTPDAGCRRAGPDIAGAHMGSLRGRDSEAEGGSSRASDVLDSLPPL
jgi:hypothetical protein